ncbi:MAG: hypothetical protein R6U17_09195, partial [Thermoplasmata archaeon]
NMIGRMREAGLVFDTHLNKLKKSKTLADKGSYQESITLAQVAVEEMEEDLSPEGEEEEVEVEEMEKEGEVKVRKEGEVEEAEKEGEVGEEEEEAKVEEAEEVEEVEVKEKVEAISIDGEEKLNIEIGGLKTLIMIARKNDIDVAGAGEMINKAMISANKGAKQEASSFLDKGKENIKAEMEEKMSQCVENIEEILKEVEEGETKENCITHSDLAKDAWKHDDYQSAFTHISKAEELCEEAKSPYHKAADKMEHIKHLTKDLELMDKDVDDIYESIEQAKEKINRAASDEALILAEEFEEEALEDLTDKLKEVMKEAQKELQGAKLSGKNISKPIYLLKQVDINAGKENIEKSIASLKKYKEEMEKMAE